MADYSEVQAMTDIQATLEKLSDAAARGRVLRWAADKYGVLSTTSPPGAAGSPIPRSSRKNSGTQSKRKAARKQTLNPSLSKNLNLRPSGKPSFKEFAESKQPGTNLARCVVSVYYLKNVLDHEHVTVNDVYTCFKDRGWRVPADLRNTLQSAASHKAWLDTSDIENIQLVPGGENLVEYDLPSASSK